MPNVVSGLEKQPSLCSSDIQAILGLQPFPEDSGNKGIAAIFVEHAAEGLSRSSRVQLQPARSMISSATEQCYLPR